MNSALNNLHWLLCHETKPNQTNLSIYLPQSVQIYLSIYLSCDFFVSTKDGFLPDFAKSTRGMQMRQGQYFSLT